MIDEKDNFKTRNTFESSSSREPDEHTSSQNSQDTPPEKDTSAVKEILKFVIIAALIVAPIRAFIAQPFIVSGSSMAPTFENGEYLIVDEISYRLGEPKRGDVVIFKYPENPNQYFIKRLIGLPGETVIMKDGNVSIKNETYPNGKMLREEYVENMSSGDLVTTLESDQYFVLGDNRTASSDSRYWGPVDKKFMVGRSFVRLLPLGEAGVNPGAAPENMFDESDNSLKETNN